MDEYTKYNDQRFWDRFDRPKLAPYFPLNKTLNCPLIDPIDIEQSNDDSIVFGTWNLWYGWQYRIQNPSLDIVMNGMFKMGDRWNWTWVTTPFGGAIDFRSTMLTSTRYRVQLAGVKSSSHPTKGDLFSYISKRQDQPDGDRNMTYVRWDTTSSKPTVIDQNASYADLSVRRLIEVGWNNDPRTSPIPEYANGADSNYAGSFEAVPKE